jgi:hypothetical protein
MHLHLLLKAFSKRKNWRYYNIFDRLCRFLFGSIIIAANVKIADILTTGIIMNI